MKDTIKKITMRLDTIVKNSNYGRLIFILLTASCLISFISNIQAQSTIVLQAEKADTIYHGIFENIHEGYIGSGYVNLDNELGSYIVWKVNLSEGKKFTLFIRFANGGTTARTMNVFINGNLTKENYSFPSTTDWINWQTTTFDIDLKAGLNVIKMVGSNPNSGPNLDYLILNTPNSNIQPIAVNDTCILSVNEMGNIDVLKNDYDYNYDNLSISTFSQGQNGTVQMINSNILRYKPRTNFTGTDEFTYTISDGKDQTTANVKVFVQNFDWSVKTVESVLKTNTPATIGTWNYTVGLLLEGILRVYKRTHDQRYLKFICDWTDLHISDKGFIDAGITSLDNMQPGYMLLHLYNETKIEKYKLAADSIRKIFNTYPRTSDGGFWHAKNLTGQLWLDGLYMSMPFLVTYGEMFDDKQYTYQEAIKQFNTYISHLQDNVTGLLYHAYDEDGSESWALPPYNRSPYFWGRSIGWVVMGLTEILDIIPKDFPERLTIENKYIAVLKALEKYQNKDYGLWYQVIDKGDSTKNWLETSCSMMYVYAMKHAIKNNYIDASYTDAVDLGYMGVLSKISIDSNDIVYLKDICQGTGVSSDLNYYFNRQRITNDNHGLGSFLIMNELFIRDSVKQDTSHTSAKNYALLRTDNIKLFPNPCRNFVNITIDSNSPAYIIFDVTDITGKILISKQQDYNFGKHYVTLNTSDLSPGIYFGRVLINSTVKIFKFIVEK